MPSIGQTWILASIGAVVEMGILSTLKRLLMESTGNGTWPPFCHFCHFLVSTWNLCSKTVFLVNKLVFFAISLDAILPE
jgi:hypothetical protein